MNCPKCGSGELGVLSTHGRDFYNCHDCKTEFEVKDHSVCLKTHDPVTHPAHYNAGSVETIVILEQIMEPMTGKLTAFEAALLMTALKYLCRFPFKNGVEDLGKALWYLEYLKKVMGERLNADNG